VSDMNRPRVAAAAIAVTIGLAAILPTSAQAETVCSEWEFPADLTLDQSDGWHIQIPVSGTPRWNAGPGQAVFFKEGKNDPSNGTARGGMFENRIDITIDWSNGSQGKYVGQVSSDAFAFGRSRGGWTWRSTQPMTCLVESAPPGLTDPMLVPERAGTIPEIGQAG
jgi:hypothetical protein